jgi:formylglycine-generating enzyme required for sulfatase activity
MKNKTKFKNKKIYWRRIIISLVFLLSFIISSLISEELENMVLIPKGEFIRGSNNSEPDEKPESKIYLKDFYIDKYEVSNLEYRRCVEKGVCKEPKNTTFYDDLRYAHHPVVYVTYYDAVTYCRWKKKRLPTEAEWEKACRGPEGNIFPFGNDFNKVKEKCNVEGKQLAEVHSFPECASYYGVYNLSGNVWEWVEGWYDSYPGNDFKTKEFGRKYGILRGGSWNNIDWASRCSNRLYLEKDKYWALAGFRCAKSINLKPKNKK